MKSDEKVIEELKNICFPATVTDGVNKINVLVIRIEEATDFVLKTRREAVEEFIETLDDEYYPADDFMGDAIEETVVNRKKEEFLKII